MCTFNTLKPSNDYEPSETCEKHHLYLLFLFSPAALAQSKVVTGKVTDSKDGSAVPNASVLVKDTKQGTQTAADGTFKISLASSATTLTISSIGFSSQNVSIAGKTSVYVSLKAAASDQLTEIVVLGYAALLPKDVTGAVISVKLKDFNQGLILAPD